MRVGILGGGQLGTMLAEAILRLGATPVVYDPDPDAPARRRVPEVIAASFEDREALAAFFSRCDLVTYEREDLPVEALREAGPRTRFVPDLYVLEVGQDRALEKAFLARNGLECVRHLVVPPGCTLEEGGERFGFPAIAKTTRGGYDGKGQFLLRHPRDARAAQAEAPGAAWVLEEFVDIVAEASCIVARSETDEAIFPVVENLHRDHILDRSLVPSRFPANVAEHMRALALSAARKLDVRGLLAVEFFVARGGGAKAGDADALRVVVNELAPRPHNSGHIMARACTFGQFDALARILVGAPLGTPSLVPGVFCMSNLLGDVWLAQGHGDQLDLGVWRDFPEVLELNLYGKTRPERRRKMGHAIVMAGDPDDVLDRAERFREALKSSSSVVSNAPRGR
jgi:5-(carboxyamino)imidazole ribonucleotide synthase